MSTDNAMIAQVKSLPDLIREQAETIDHSVRRLLDHNECTAVKRIVIAGCGDSHNAGVATELAFEELAGIPTEPMTAMQASRYGVAYQPTMFPGSPLVLGISVSGTVVRTREALQLARQRGALTVGVTGNPDSPLGQAAERVLTCAVPPFVDAPGVRSYRISLLALFLLSIRLAEATDRIDQAEADRLRQELIQSADAIEATIAAAEGPAQALAKSVAQEKNFVFVGDGPNWGTALFNAAKIIEAAGRHAIGQETEEWAHLQYFVEADPATPTFLISPGGRGHGRAAELLEPLRRIGRRIVAVVPEGDRAIAPQADVVLPVVGSVSELFSPMVYPVAGELFAAYLADEIGASFFRSGSHVYPEGGNTIRTSQLAVSHDSAAVEGG